jgi:hypothetical protein
MRRSVTGGGTNFSNGLGSGRSDLFQAGSVVLDRDALPFGKAGQTATSLAIASG